MLTQECLQGRPSYIFNLTSVLRVWTGFIWLRVKDHLSRVYFISYYIVLCTNPQRLREMVVIRINHSINQHISDS
jgi:hypothetical protein